MDAVFGDEGVEDVEEGGEVVVGEFVEAGEAFADIAKPRSWQAPPTVCGQVEIDTRGFSFTQTGGGLPFQRTSSWSRRKAPPATPTTGLRNRFVRAAR